MKKTTEYCMTVQPALLPEERHRIAKILDGLNYEVLGSGQMVDGSECDISFIKRKDLPLMKKKVRMKKSFNDFLIGFKKNSSKKKRTYAGITFCQRDI